MSDVELTCPYCNARVPPAVGTRQTCPRCGESFAPLPQTGVQVPPGLATAPAPPPCSLPILAGKPIRANRIVGGIVLGGMLLMALTGLTYALLTQHVRREHDKALPRRSHRPALPPLADEGKVEAVAPARLEALGYLPADTGIVAGIQMRELLASPAGKELRDRPIRLGKTELRLGALKQWLGLAVEDVDHAVLGVLVRDTDVADLTPPTHLVVRTSKPYDGERLRKAIEARQPREERAPGGGKRTLYTAKVSGLPVTLWLADDRTIVLGLFSNLEEVPARAHEGIDHLPSELRSLLRERLPAGTPLWMAGHAEDWKKTWLPTLLAGLPGVPVLARLEQVKSFAVGVFPEKPIKVQGAFRCRDESAARKIAEGELAPLAKKQPQRFTYSRDGAWLDVQWKAEKE